MKRIIVTVLFALFTGSLLNRSSVASARDGEQARAVTVVAAGDMACDPTSPHFVGGQGDSTDCQMKATSDLVLAAHPAAVLVLGDQQYENGSLPWFLQSYDPTWGRFKPLTHPVPGNHDYQTRGAAGYFAYFGDLAGAPSTGYYSFNVGDWHAIALNSECSAVGGCGPGSPEELWLLADLAANRQPCTLAYWHYPRFTSGRNLNHPEMGTFWDDLYAHGVTLVLNGHDHEYERFAPQNPRQVLDSRGIREFIVGSGGNSHMPTFGPIQPNSELRDNKSYGVLRLVLRPTSYDWEFLPSRQTGNGKLTDSGTGVCPGATGTPNSGAEPRAVPIVSASGYGGVVSRFTVNFDSTKPGQGWVQFGSGPGCSGLVMTATGDRGAGTTHHSFGVSGNDLPGTVGDNGIQPGTTYWYQSVTFTSSGKEVNDNQGKCYRVTIPRA